jgi:hypothetical protein
MPQNERHLFRAVSLAAIEYIDILLA